ncbi:cyclin-B1-5-like isoform X1 [Phragmites australis]|uniref:cyclin-B1-5-like isoform X1 n=1 Tax=Phragmites australis TaxID=29695 RepID=UPI002D797A34|nr:cyclin-B1-5-like isoform X1 [Phragmites australis]
MATRNHRAVAAPQPANRGAAVLAGRQKAAAAAGRPDRRALGDIGNFTNIHVIDGKKVQLPEGVNRPITRSFGAQLLKNAQANAAVANKNAVAPALPAVARAAPKPTKKAPAKPVPRPEQAIKITAGSDENRRPSEGAARSSSAHKSRKKVVSTLTTVLIARSKHASGLTGKPKELIEDIDKLDGDNQLAVIDYVEDIYKFYKAAQHESRPTDYMGSQPELSTKMRAILTNWIIDVHSKLELMPETLYLIMYMVDRYLSLQTVARRELQLVGIAALLIACKYEEIWAPEVSEFIHLSDNAYTRQEILGMEKAILNKLEWNLTVPTPYVFLVRFAKAAGSGDKELEHMVFFFAELALMAYSMVTFCPSMVAAAAVYAARCTLRKSPLWTETLKHHTGFDELQLIECANILIRSHAAAPDGKLTTIYKKYTTEEFGRAALHPPAAVPGLV